MKVDHGVELLDVSNFHPGCFESPKVKLYLCPLRYIFSIILYVLESIISSHPLRKLTVSRTGITQVRVAFRGNVGTFFENTNTSIISSRIWVCQGYSFALFVISYNNCTKHLDCSLILTSSAHDSLISGGRTRLWRHQADLCNTKFA